MPIIVPDLARELKCLFYLRPPTANEILIKKLGKAREEYLCTLSVYKETSGHSPLFETISHRLTASEKNYSYWLKVAREKVLCQHPAPYNPIGYGRGTYYDNQWYPW